MISAYERVYPHSKECSAEFLSYGQIYIDICTKCNYNKNRCSYVRNTRTVQADIRRLYVLIAVERPSYVYVEVQ